MSLVPLFHPLAGQGGILQDCAPNSPRDAWAWLAQRPTLAARVGVNHILAHSPSSRLHVLYLTSEQYQGIERDSRVGVLCAWTAEFDTWQPGHEVVLEAGDNQTQYSLRSVRYFLTMEEMLRELQGLAGSGMSLVANQGQAARSSSADELEAATPIPEPAGIPIPSRTVRGRGQPAAYVGVLIELSPLTPPPPTARLED
jgi:hypothetical protein